MEAQSSFFRADDHWPFTGTDCTVRYSQYLRSRSTCFSSSLRRSHRTQQRTLGPCCWDYRKEYESQQGQEWPTGNFSKGEEDSILLPSQRRPLLQQPSAFECQLRSRHNTWLPAIFNHAKQKHRLHSLLVADQAAFRCPNFLQRQRQRQRRLERKKATIPFLPSFTNYSAQRSIGYCLLSSAINLADGDDAVNCPLCSHSGEP